MSIARSSVGPPADLDELVARACRQVGIPIGRQRLLRHYGNAVYLIEDAQIVARVAYGAGSVDRARTAVAVTQWLTSEGFPATEPTAVAIGDQPVIFAGPGEVAVTFWRYYPQPPQDHGWDLAVLGHTARRLHDFTSAPPIPLPTFTPLRSIRQTVRNALAAGHGQEDELRWLSHRVDSLLQQWESLEFPLATGLIHGDMYSGNLLRGVDGSAVLGDWDSVCVGPREIDLAPTFSAARFGLETASIDRFAIAYGYDLRGWPGYWTLRAIREVSTLTALVRLAPIQESSATELRHRLRTLRSNDSATTWNRR
jgi:aminoglycoside phosphotransferase (APT) family kinase protein